MFSLGVYRLLRWELRPSTRAGRIAPPHPKQLVDCVLEPWTHSLTRIEQASTLAVSQGGRRSIWGLTLTGGQRCIAAQGAHSGF